MYPKFNLSHTSIVILTLVGTLVCAVAALVAFEQWPTQQATVRSVDTTPRANDSSETEVRRVVDLLELRAAEAGESRRQETPLSLAEEKPTNTYFIRSF